MYIAMLHQDDQTTSIAGSVQRMNAARMHWPSGEFSMVILETQGYIIYHTWMDEIMRREIMCQYCSLSCALVLCPGPPEMQA